MASKSVPSIRFYQIQMVCQGIAVDEELSGGLADDHTVFQVHAQGVDQAGSVCLVVIHQPDDGVVIYFYSGRDGSGSSGDDRGI